MEAGADQGAAFNGIVKRYDERLLKFRVYALGGSFSAAEDCTEEVLLIPSERRDRLRDAGRQRPGGGAAPAV